MSAALSSMTGFARAERQSPAMRLRIEIRSVNGRGLDMRLRLASGLDALEIPLRQLLSKSLSRGSVNLVATLDRTARGGAVRVNRQALQSVLAVLEELGQSLEAAPPRLDGILALPGVLEVDDGAGELDEEDVAGLLLACAGEAVDKLQVSRRQEGAEIAVVLLAQLDAISALADRAETHPARSRDHIEARLRDQLAALRDDAALPQERLAQEALLLATKADIQEELDRLRAHIVAARQLIAAGGPVGRRLDFLAQEFNREANTLCAKANAVELTAIGLDLKAAIDQLREQVQNIE
ncbi:YicC/YloC family endoribonuclease [Devosia sp. YIM 151766]|uniref:YicC/YloC family endoribonuclease n=1 Tax=Devosia sp. YIM 151766 TaxID=3017325 RepID=UPI00255C29E3|nr:YicC/YloC family endoribonuclease [Devosia sp. YIM 151766]WIY53817.1 YicC/YloC family endoribonuclease [Devosia sp. YIM 151766]